MSAERCWRSRCRWFSRSLVVFCVYSQQPVSLLTSDICARGGETLVVACPGVSYVCVLAYPSATSYMLPTLRLHL
eukprot:scaffold47153_cov58-Phaeocystis_antarctica.AAC.4